MSKRTRTEEQALTALFDSLPWDGTHLWLLWTERGYARDIDRSSWSPNPASLGWGFVAREREQDNGGNVYDLRVHVGPLPDGYGVIPLEEVKYRVA